MPSSSLIRNYAEDWYTVLEKTLVIFNQALYSNKCSTTTNTNDLIKQVIYTRVQIENLQPTNASFDNAGIEVQLEMIMTVSKGKVRNMTAENESGQVCHICGHHRSK